MSDNRPMREKDEKNGASDDISVAGLNDNLEFFGRQLHIQTERIGFPSPRIVTQVFSNGRVVFSRKSEIMVHSGDPNESSMLQEWMRNQHLQVIRDIETKQKRILNSTANT